MDQTVMNFTTVAARSSAIPTPTTGMVSYVGDTGSDSATNATIVDVPQIQAYTGSDWQNMDGLTLVAKANIGTAVSSVTVTNAFSATYENYKVIISNGVGSAGAAPLAVRLGATITGYDYNQIYMLYGSSTITGFGSTNQAQWLTGKTTTDNLDLNIDLRCPFVAKATTFAGTHSIGFPLLSFGQLVNTTSYTDLVIFPNSGTITGGTIYVYGYRSA
jgi:hypothetical protein